MDTSSIKVDGNVPAPVSYESLQEASELLLDNLGSSELSSRTIQWDNFPALMKLWEVLWQAQASLVQEAERLEEALEALKSEDESLKVVKADLEEIRAGKHDERDRHFALGLYWRRHAIWRYFRAHLHQPEKARDLLHLYLVKPVGGGQQTGETCRPKCNTKTEQALLLDLASKQRNRIRQLAQWLTDHPQAAALLRDTKGKGKSKARDDEQNDIVVKQKTHFERCLEEVESRQRLKELISSTNDWVSCFKSRLQAIRDAKTMVTMLEEGQRLISSAKSSAMKKQKRQSNGAPTVEVQVAQVTKRRRTVDRGTSPIPEVVGKSIYLDQSRDYGEHRSSPEIVEHRTNAGPSLPTTLAQETALQEDDSPPSPQSLPSPPPHAQAYQRQTHNTTDESQQSTTDSSFKPPSIPSVRNLPSIQSSSSADDGFRTIVIREINSVSRASGVQKEAQETTQITVQQPLKKLKKRISKVPPITPELNQLLEEAALQAEKKRKEEKEALGMPSEDPWKGLQEWVPPESQKPPAVKSELNHSPDKKDANESILGVEMTGEMYTAKSHAMSFEILDGEGSDLASQERIEREEVEAGIQQFLRSEDL